MDPSESTCVEFLRPKTVPKQLIALGTVSQVADNQLKLQITGGIVCLVDRFNISQPFTDRINNYEQKRSKGVLKPSDECPRLGEIFSKGQQYICKVIDVQTRKGYVDAQDITATINPIDIQEETVASTLFAIPQIPLQSAIQSVEDHGYRLDVGFKGLTGFLRFEEAEDYCRKHNDGKKFAVGQVIRCCTIDETAITSDSRVIQLSMRKEMMKKSHFDRKKTSQHTLTESCIPPGSVGFLTVMRVQKNGLIVNFMDEFSGFVGMDHLKEDWHSPSKNYKISDQMKCSVLYYNSTTKTFALSLKQPKMSKKTLKLLVNNYYVGQIIRKADFVFVKGTKAVYFKIDNLKAIANVRDALEEDVATMNSDELHLALDAAYPEGSKHKCRIKSINLADLTIIVSLKQDFLSLSVVSIDELEPADFIEATVKKHVKDGVIVNFGLNLKGIILNVHLHEYVSSKSHQRYPIGKTIKCRVLKIDADKQPPRVYLTNKEQLMDPEMAIIDCYDKSFRGETVNAIVCKLKHDGVIVELFNNVKGFIPKRFCSTVPLKTVSDLFEVGQITSCTVYRVEPHRQTLLLGIIPYDKIKEMKKEKRRKLKDRKQRGDKEKSIAQSDEEAATKEVSSPVTKGKKRTKTDAEAIEDSAEKRAKKSRLERSIEAKLREERVREAEKNLLDPNRPAQSIDDFERLVLKSPNSADTWIRYSKFFLDNVETEKARIICRRALKTINFRLEKEKLKIWLHMIKIEARFGGSEKLHEVLDEAAQTNDRTQLFTGAAKALVSCGELEEAEKLHEAALKLNRKSSDIWIGYIMFLMQQRKDLDRARELFDKAYKSLGTQSDIVHVRSKFALFEFKFGDVERGKTMFENLLSEYPKRQDLRKVYEDAVRKAGAK